MKPVAFLDQGDRSLEHRVAAIGEIIQRWHGQHVDLSPNQQLEKYDSYRWVIQLGSDNRVITSAHSFDG